MTIKRLIPLAVAAVLLALTATDSRASTSVGPCVLHAYPVKESYTTGGFNAFGRGRIDSCSLAYGYQMRMVVCVQVLGSNGTWYTATDSVTGGSACTGDLLHWTSWDDVSSLFGGVWNHTYRTDAYGYVAWADAYEGKHYYSTPCVLHLCTS